MKKLLAIILLCVLLVGCSSHEVETNEATESPVAEVPTAPAAAEAESPTEAETEPVDQQLPMVAVSIPLSVETMNANDGNMIFRKTSQSMQLTMRDPDVADKIILDFLNRVDTLTADADTVRQAAEAAYTADDTWVTYFHDVIYTVNRADHGVLSMYGELTSYSGGNRPISQCLAANYNMVSGDVLTLGSILYHIDCKDDIANLVISNLDSVAEEKSLFDEYQDIVKQRFERDESFDEDWYFTNKGLSFYFAPYEIAPYSSGVIIAEIPYSDLVGLISAEFFPAEEVESNGELFCVSAENAKMDQFTQIAEVIADNDGKMFFLYTNGTVRNVHIQTIPSADDYVIEASTSVFATYTLTPGDAIMLKILPSEESPNLQISYESGGETQVIILSGEYLNG